MALKQILEDIQEDANTEYEDTVARAKAEALRMQSDKEAELAAYYDNERKKLEGELRKLTGRLRARAELDSLKNFQQEEKQVTDSLLSESFLFTVSTLKSSQSNYLEWLLERLKKASDILDKGEISIRLSEEDTHLFNELKKKSALPLVKGPAARTAAGFICTAGKSYVDCTLETLYRQMEPGIMRIIRDYLK